MLSIAKYVAISHYFVVLTPDFKSNHPSSDTARGVQLPRAQQQQHSVVNNRGDVELVVKTNSAAVLSCSAPPSAAVTDTISADPLSDASFPENGKQ